MSDMVHPGTKCTNDGFAGMLTMLMVEEED